MAKKKITLKKTDKKTLVKAAKKVGKRKRLKVPRKKALSPAKKKRVIEKIGRLSSDSVVKHTGKDWDQWLEIFEAAGASVWPYKELTSFLKKKYKIKAYWQHLVAYGYEVHLGRRIDGQNQKGLYSVTTTKTLSIDQKSAWELFTSERGLRAWLNPMSEITFAPKNYFEIEGGIFGEIRTMKSPERVRFTWQDSDWEKPTFVQAYILARPQGKSMLIFMHDSIKSAALKEDLRLHWKKATDQFVELINSEN